MALACALLFPFQLPVVLLQLLAGLLLQLLRLVLPPPLPPDFSWKIFRAFLGPGWLIAMAYLDPGNLEGDLQAGSHRRAVPGSPAASLAAIPVAGLSYCCPSSLAAATSRSPEAASSSDLHAPASAAVAAGADAASDAPVAPVQHSALLLLQQLWPEQQQQHRRLVEEQPPLTEESRYSLLWVLLWGHAAGAVFQVLAARLGNTTGLDLATLCRRQLSRRMAAALWLLTELAIIGADVQAVLGCAVALKLLIGAPVWLGVIVTLVDCFTLLWFNGDRTP